MAVPGPVRRLVRNRGRLVALGLLAATTVAASTLQSTSALVLQQTLDENWRGTYDLLVTQAGKDPDQGDLVRSDALVDAGMGRLSMADLALVRGLPGVEVAAPVALVSFAEPDLVGEPVVWLPVPVRADASLEDPQAFRVTVSSTLDDGIAARELATQTVTALAYLPSYSTYLGRDELGQPLYETTPLADGPRLISADETISFTAGEYDLVTGSIPLGLSLAPRPAATIALVDPVAERALLGDAGAFLDPLLRYRGDGQPLVVLDRLPSTLRLSVELAEFEVVTPGRVGGTASGDGVLIRENGQIAPVLDAEAPSSVVAEYVTDASVRLDPFSADRVLLGGETDARADAAAPVTAGPAPRSVAAARYELPAVEGDAARLIPRGYRSFSLYSEAPLPGIAPQGSVTEYAKLFGAVGRGTPLTQEGVSGYFDVVGSFRPDELRALAGETSFMPLGGYDVVTPQLVADAAGDPVTARPLATSITGFGVPGTNDIAVGSLSILDGLGVDRPISAIRVRVSGIDSYSPGAQQRLLTAASGLEALGFEATIMAGSSPQQLPVLVSGYALAATDDQGRQLIGDLGYIEQEWSRLGAVREADAAVSATSVALLVVSIVSVGVLLSVVQLGSIPARRATAGVLRQLGWRRRRIARWFLAEEIVALLAVAAVGGCAVLLASVRPVASVAVGVALGLVVVTSLAAVAVSARAPRATARRRRARAEGRASTITGPRSFGVRLARTQPMASVSLGLAMVIVPVGVAVAATVFAQGRELAGPSALGAVASARAWVPQGALAAVTLGAGIVLAVLARRMGLSRRREQWAAIRAMGWTGADVTRAHLAELAVSAAPGVLAGVALAAGVAAQLPGLLVPVLVASTAGGVLALSVVLLTGRRID